MLPPDVMRIYQFRKCRPQDLDSVMELQETAYRGIKNKDIFVTSDRTENERYLQPPNFILGCFDGNRLIAYCSFAFPGDSSENLGWDLLWKREKVLSCAALDTVVVHPAYRGQNLQQRLMDYAAALILDHPNIKYILTTVSPLNEYSLRNVEAAGYQVVGRKPKYGGKDRFILCLSL
jgi:ribosomal protein S18 acetylase RimI-like enzyme